MELLRPDDLNRVFGLVCGQNPAHTWAPGGLWLPCCQRCLGLYAGAALALLLHATARPKLSGRFLGVHGVFLALMIPLGFHWIEQGPFARMASGLLFGFAVMTFLWLPFTRERSGDGLEERTRSLTYWLSLAAAVLALPGAASAGGRTTAWVLSLVALSGVLALAVFGLGTLWLAVANGLRCLRTLILRRG